jgi:hypothetical protein
MWPCYPWCHYPFDFGKLDDVAELLSMRHIPDKRNHPFPKQQFEAFYILLLLGELF